MSEWISVEDKRPTKGERVIWFHPEKRDSHGGIRLREYLRVDRHDLLMRPATHWMPLPEPPSA